MKAVMREWTEGDHRRQLHLSVIEDDAVLFHIVPCPAAENPEVPRGDCHVLVRV